jgi:hypothetical protein
MAEVDTAEYPANVSRRFHHASHEIPALRIRPTPGWKALNLRELWQFRELLWFLALRDIKVRYKQTLLGVAWAVIQPVMAMLLFSIFFGRLGGLAEKTPDVPYSVFVFCALVPWQLFSSALTQSSNSVVSEQRLLTKVYFPRLIIPISPLLSALVDFGISFALLLGMMVYYSVQPGAAILLSPFSLVGGFQRDLPGRAVHDSVSDAVLAVRDPDCLSDQYRSRAMAVGLRPESDGRRGGRLPLGPPRYGVAFRTRPGIVVAHGFGAAGRRPVLLPADGENLRRRGVTLMGDIAIRVEGLGKRYRIGQRQRYKTLRESIMQGLAVPYRRLQSAFQHSNGKASHADGMIWALKDVSFEVKHGEVLGVIGRNGAGKSTLLKILSRITEPTEGYADICGRVGSLLEVGTGFHPELTGGRISISTARSWA